METIFNHVDLDLDLTVMLWRQLTAIGRLQLERFARKRDHLLLIIAEIRVEGRSVSFPAGNSRRVVRFGWLRRTSPP
ncbi:hypothetical protein [Sphingomonas oryzagri]